MELRTIKNLSLRNKTVLLRVNFDVPIKNSGVSDDTRILAHLPTINFLLKQGAKVILISHLGRPSEVNSMRLKIQRYGLRPVFKYLKKSIKDLEFIESLEWPIIKEEVKNKKIVLLENLRFYPGEKDNNPNFTKFLASLADIYINDAFAVAHRNHASVSAITQYLPSYAGLLLEKEIEKLSEVLNKSKKPFIAVMGGAKISSKLPVLKNLSSKVDKILVGGALANDLLKTKGYNIGKSMVEKKLTKFKLEIEKKIVLPVDVVTSSKLKVQNSKLQFKIQNLKVEELNKLKNRNFKILDIGEETVELFADYIKNAKMIIWNGPMGLFEERPFDQGTKKIAEMIVKNKKAKIIIGGGDTIAVHKIKNKKQKIKNNAFISTGGGAMLEFLSGKKLPGIKGLL